MSASSSTMTCTAHAMLDEACNLPIARYRFSARVCQGVQLPAYAGSLLRGQFGAALRHLACMTRQPACSGCALQSTCPYPRIFEAPAAPDHPLQRFSNIPNAYVVEPPPPLQCGPQDAPHAPDDPYLPEGAMLVFHMVLVGDALTQLALVIVAWQRALAQGLTRSRSRIELHTVQWQDAQGQWQPIWSSEQPHIQPHAARLVLGAAPVAAQALCLDIHTPLRLQQQGRPLKPQELTPRTLISAVARRVALVLEFHAHQAHWGGQVPAASALAEQLTDQRQLVWFDWKRYSSRQRQEMTLGGVLGQWHLQASAPVLAALWPWLYLGQWLHVGKNATFGMGGYRLQVV